MVEMKVSGIILEPKSRSPIVVLKDLAEKRALLIWVGEPEANAILMGLEQVETPRPLTHDLFLATVCELGATIREVSILAMKEKTFFAEIVLETRRGEHRVDARPSDALALALRVEAPINVAEEVLEQSGIPIRQEGEEGAPAGRSDDEDFRRFLENVKPSDFSRLGGGDLPGDS
jgi:bifunctional DNase/RNase